jgi:hypothetical protein
MNGGDPEQIALNLTCRHKAVAFVANQILDAFNPLSENLKSLVEDILPRRADPSFGRRPGGNGKIGNGGTEVAKIAAECFQVLRTVVDARDQHRLCHKIAVVVRREL